MSTFTREDVERLRDVANYYEGIYDGDDGEYYRMYAWAFDLANRIEAKLLVAASRRIDAEDLPCTIENGETVTFVGPEITLTFDPEE